MRNAPSAKHFGASKCLKSRSHGQSGCGKDHQPAMNASSQHRRRMMPAHVLTKAELQAWLNMLSDEEERKVMQAKLDTDPDWVRKKIEKAMQAAFDEAVEKGVLIPKGLNERGQTIYRSNIYRARHG